MHVKTYFTATDIAFTSLFSVMWAILNLVLGPLGFALFGLPVLCDFAVFFTLLLTTWTVSKFGVASLVGIIGSTLTLLARGQPVAIGFGASALVFDVLMLASRHKLNPKPVHIAAATAATVASAYFAGVVIGIFFMSGTLQWALTFWGPWHLVGGAIGAATAFPVIILLEKTGVRNIKNA